MSGISTTLISDGLWTIM